MLFTAMLFWGWAWLEPAHGSADNTPVLLPWWGGLVGGAHLLRACSCSSGNLHGLEDEAYLKQRYRGKARIEPKAMVVCVPCN